MNLETPFLNHGGRLTDLLAFLWILLTSLYAFVLFGWDKHCAEKRGKPRVSEFHLAAASAVGGWPGGLAAMLLFRHKTAKATFKIKFALAIVIWICLAWVYWTAIR